MVSYYWLNPLAIPQPLQPSFLRIDQLRWRILGLIRLLHSDGCDHLIVTEERCRKFIVPIKPLFGSPKTPSIRQPSQNALFVGVNARDRFRLPDTPTQRQKVDFYQEELLVPLPHRGPNLFWENVSCC